MAVVLVSSRVRSIFGLAAISGIINIDPFVLNLAQGSVAGMSLSPLAAAILIVASLNRVLKVLNAVRFGGLRTCRNPASVLLAVAAAWVAFALPY